MAEISAAAVKSLRDKTSLPMMECKKALIECNGDEQAAIDYLRKSGVKKMMGRAADRETAFGRIVAYGSIEDGRGAMIELQCESDPVANNAEVRQLADDLAKAMANSSANTPEELLEQPSPSNPSETLGERLNDITNRIREVFRLPRVVRVEAPCGSYSHHTGTAGVLVEVSGDDQELANSVAMQVAAMNPSVANRDELDPAAVEKERNLQKEIARNEGKPENIIEKMIEGRMRLFYEQHVLLDQAYVKDESKKVEKVLKAAKMEVKRFLHWKLGGEKVADPEAESESPTE